MLTANSTVSLVLDLIGVFVFGLAGGLTAVTRRLDVFGTVVLATVTALGGGMLRDVLTGRVPPAGLADWRYLVVAGSAGMVAFIGHPWVKRLSVPILVFDALGLGLFTVTGTTKALSVGLGPVPSAVLGVMTGVGGGVLRDVLTREVPVVLHRELYAVPSLAGAIVVVVAGQHHPVASWLAISAAALVAGLRLTAVRLGWQPPRAVRR